jgi:hypothetical protein
MKDSSEILGDYKGLPITGTSVVVNKLGDGLSKAVDVEPLVPDVGEDVYIACRVRKTKDRYDVVRDDSGNAVSYTLVQIFDSTGAMFTDAKLARAGIQKMQERIKKLEAERKGQLELLIEDNVTPLHKDIASKVDEAFKDAK